MTADTDQSVPHNHSSVILTTRRGREVRVRHIVPEDVNLLVDLYKQLSPETRRLRFFTPRPQLPDELLWPEAMRLSNIDPLVEAALIAVVPGIAEQQSVGVARLVREQPESTSAEVAIVLRDDYQAEGLGTQLFDLLLQVALVRGLTRLRALTLAENVAMQRLVRNSGLPFTLATSYGETNITIMLADETAAPP